MDLDFLPSPNDVLHGAGEFGLGVIYGGLEMPIDGITQLINVVSPVDVPELNIVDPDDHKNFWFKAGIVTGVALDTVVLSAAVNSGLTSYAATHQATAPYLKTALKGFALSAMQPVPEGENFWSNKVLHTGLRMATMQLGTGIGQVAGKLPFVPEAASRTIGQELMFRGITGLPKGALSTQINSVGKGLGPASLQETAAGALKSSINSMVSGAVSELFDSSHAEHHDTIPHN